MVSSFAREAQLVVECTTDVDPADCELAERQVFSPAERCRARAGTAAQPRSIVVAAELHDSEINVGMQSFCFCGVRGLGSGGIR